MNHLTVVGGGIAGLTAAIEAAEAGLTITLLEAKAAVGGHAQTTEGPFRANWGPHVIYDDGPFWAWLARRGLAEPAAKAPRIATFALRIDGTRHRVPPLGFVRAVRRIRTSTAPVEASFMDWAVELVGEVQARRVANFAGVATFDHNPGRLSAAFVQEIVRRATSFPPHPRYMPGGWSTMAERMAAHARGLGVEIRTGSRVDALPDRPVVLAIPLPVVAALTGQRGLVETGTRTALLDLGLSGRRPPFVISDLDASGWVETFSIPDPSLAPKGQHLVQAQAGMASDETLDQAIERIEDLLDVGMPGWRGREVWRRRAKVANNTGALDLPGTTWRDRPAIERGDGVYVAGDMVAAPGLLSEVSHGSAVAAVAAVVRDLAYTRSTG